MPGSAPARRLGVRALARGLGGLHRILYRASGGRIGGSVGGMSILLLTTTGRRTGKPRTNPLSFSRDGPNLVVIASNGGMSWSPAWWLNLRDNPEAGVQIGRERRRVRARRSSPAEQARLWTEITSRTPAYLAYQRRTTRPIPVVILEPTDEPRP
jgi:deazaflavin-dependent oxidoreductase (nitroreductase family)